MHRQVRVLMHKGVLTCKPETTIQDAARHMVENDVSALVIADAEGQMVGLLSRTDLVRARLQEQERWRNLSVSDLMVRDVVTVRADDTLKQASELMMSRHIHRVVVVEENGTRKTPIGILSMTDVVRDMSQLE